MSGVAAKIAHERAKAAGVGSFQNPVKFAGQDFETLRAECLASKTLFEDPKFPAAESSLGWSLEADAVKGIVWKRPSDIQKNAAFIIGGANLDDVCQGALNDCWLLSSIACLTTNKDCLSHVIPPGQSFDNNYAGIVHFLFWRYGQWVDVVVDDRLPTENNRLKYVKSSTANEFWSALLEKAYAKINGSYQTLHYGFVMEALEDLTGAVCEVYRTSPPPEDLYQKVQRSLLESCLVACTSVAAGKDVKDDLSREKIVYSHVYSITGAEEVSYKNGVVQLIRVRNPWGDTEWNGAWSDNSAEWDDVDPNVRARLNIKGNDGEVWMTFQDFLKQYLRVEMCNLNLSDVLCGEDYKWRLTEFNGSWKTGSTAGGNHELHTFWINPQYRITLEAPDGDPNKKCTVVVSLSQKDKRKMKPDGAKDYKISYFIYKVKPADKIPLGKDFFKNNQPVAKYRNFVPYRDVSDRAELLPGDYVIVVATYSVSQDGDFYLRVFTKKSPEAEGKGNNAPGGMPEPILTPDTDAEFDIVKDQLQKGEFNEEEVKSLLRKMLQVYPEIQSDGLSTETVRQLIKLMDVDNTGTLSTDEFKKLWVKVKNYMNIFKSADEDKSGTISVPELRVALKEAEFTIPLDTIEAIAERFGLETRLEFVELLGIMARLEMLFNMFNILDPNQSGSISLSLSEWLQTASV